MNAGAGRIKGYAAEEIIGQHFSRFYPQNAIDRGWGAHELKVAKAEGRFEDEGWRVRKDGSQFWANVVITALHDEAGSFVGYSKITRDLTERKQAEENARRLTEEAAARRSPVAEENARLIQEQRERLHVTLASIGDAVISTDAQGRVDYLNPVAEELVGWRSGEAAGKMLEDVFRIVSEQTRQPVENPVARVLKEGRTVGLANHMLLVARDGSERPIDDSAAPNCSQEGEVIGCVLVFRDVTQQRRAKAVLLRQTSLLEQTHDAIFVWEFPGRILSWNQAAGNSLRLLEGRSARQGEPRPLGHGGTGEDRAAGRRDEPPAHCGDESRPDARPPAHADFRGWRPHQVGAGVRQPTE